MFFIFYMSSRPSPEIIRSMPIFLGIKLVHMMEYGLLYYLLKYAVIKTTNYTKTDAFVLALAITVLYGLTDELHQVFVIGRSASLLDVVANGVGGCLVALSEKLYNKGS